jgi:hypothetical protein
MANTLNVRLWGCEIAQMFARGVQFPGGLNLAGNLELRKGCQELAELEQKVVEN